MRQVGGRGALGELQPIQAGRRASGGRMQRDGSPPSAAVLDSFPFNPTRPERCSPPRENLLIGEELLTSCRLGGRSDPRPGRPRFRVAPPAPVWGRVEVSPLRCGRRWFLQLSGSGSEPHGGGCPFARPRLALGHDATVNSVRSQGIPVRARPRWIYPICGRSPHSRSGGSRSDRGRVRSMLPRNATQVRSSFSPHPPPKRPPSRLQRVPC